MIKHTIRHICNKFLYRFFFVLCDLHSFLHPPLPFALEYKFIIPNSQRTKFLYTHITGCGHGFYDAVIRKGFCKATDSVYTYLTHKRWPQLVFEKCLRRSLDQHCHTFLLLLDLIRNPFRLFNRAHVKNDTVLYMHNIRPCPSHPSFRAMCTRPLCV